MGSRENILVWRDPWIPNLPSYLPSPHESTDTSQVLVVDQLMTIGKNDWNVDILKELFDDAIVLAIKNIPRWSPSQYDGWVWLKISNGDFSVKSAYRELNHQDHTNQDNEVKASIWKTSIHDRFKMLLWRIASNLLPTSCSMARFNPNVNTTCCLCDLLLETSLHIFWECSLAKALWYDSKWGIRIDSFPLVNPLSLIAFILSQPTSLRLDSIASERFLLWGVCHSGSDLEDEK
jgi:hypothetical protein